MAWARTAATAAEERVELIEKLAASLDSASREKIDQLWADEAEDRLNAYDEGKIKAVPVAEIDRRLSEHSDDPSSAVPWEKVRRRITGEE